MSGGVSLVERVAEPTTLLLLRSDGKRSLPEVERVVALYHFLQGLLSADFDKIQMVLVHDDEEQQPRYKQVFHRIFRPMSCAIRTLHRENRSCAIRLRVLLRKNTLENLSETRTGARFFVAKMSLRVSDNPIF